MFNQVPKFFTGIENREAHLLKLLCSAGYFAFAFMAVNYSAHAWSTANAWDLGHRPLFSYDGMDVLKNTSGWSVYRIAWVYVTPPLWGLMISLVSLAAFNYIDGTSTHVRTILFWFAVNGFLLFFSYQITGILSGQDFTSKLFTGFVSYYSWLFWGKTKIYGVLTFQTIVSLAYPLLFSKGILQLNYSRLLAAKNNGKIIIFLHIVVVPVVVGCVIVAISTFPMDFGYQVVRMMCLLPVLLVSLLGMSLYKAKHISIAKGGLGSVSIVAVALLMLALFASRFVLSVPVEPFW